MLLITIFCLLLPGAFYLVNVTQGTDPCPGSREKNLEIKSAFLWGKNVVPKNHRFYVPAAADGPVNLSKMMRIFHTFQITKSKKGQLPPPMGFTKNWQKKVHPKVASSSAPMVKYILSQQKNFNLPVQF